MKYTNIQQKQQEEEIVQNKCQGKVCKKIMVLGLVIMICIVLRYVILGRLQIIRSGSEHNRKQSAHSLTYDINLNSQLKLQSADNTSNNVIIDKNAHNFSQKSNVNKQSQNISNSSFRSEDINKIVQQHDDEKINPHPNLQNNQNINMKPNIVKQQNINLKLQQQTKPVQKSTIKIDPQILNDAIEQSGKNQRAGISSKKVQLWKQFISLKSMPLSSDLAQQQKEYFQQKYNISHFPELPFCVVVPTFQNIANNRYLNNIKSILQQDYSNFHVVIIDDASRDGTGTGLQNFVKQFSISDQKLKIVLNEQRKMAMPNIYRAAKQFCKPYELFVIVDGDDEIIGKQVLKLFNSVFQSKDVWLVYSNFITGNGNIGFSRPYHEFIISNNGYRKGPFTTSHLRVFYTKLLTLVDEKDLKNQKDEWFRAANDVAMYIPIMQLCHNRLTYIPQISYLYNANTGLNNHKNKFKQQRNNQKLVRDRKGYSALDKLFTQQQILKQNSDKNKRIQLRTNVKQGYKKFDWEQ